MPAEPPIDPRGLDSWLQAAARSEDAGALAEGYGQAARRAAGRGRPDEAGFFSTHAYVWALVAGDWPRAEDLARELRQSGRLD